MKSRKAKQEAAWKKANAKRWRIIQRKSATKRRKELRKEFIIANDSMCACCDIDILEFLTLDHIKKPIKRSDNPYRDIKNKKLPAQLLCMGCNLAKGVYGVCPHITTPKMTAHHKLKLQVIKKYGNKCNCCKETNPYFLVIDHSDGKGSEHRKEIDYESIIRWLHRNNYPKAGFRLLCINCNHALGIYGYCPHDK